VLLYVRLLLPGSIELVQYIQISLIPR